MRPTVTVRPTVGPSQLPSPTPETPTTMQQLMQTVTLQAIKDTYVNASSPASNYGAYHRLRVDGWPRVWSVIAFDISSAINNIAQSKRQSDSTSKNEPRRTQVIRVVDAKLRLYTLDAGSGGIVFALPNANQWADTSLTWNNLGQINRSGEFQVGSMSWVNAFEWHEIDVTAAFADKGVQNFLIKSDSRNGVAFASRERNSGSFSPELVLTFTSEPSSVSCFMRNKSTCDQISDADIFHSSFYLFSPLLPRRLGRHIIQQMGEVVIF